MPLEHRTAPSLFQPVPTTPSKPMKTITSSLLFLLLAATSAATLATDPKIENRDARPDVSTERSNDAPAATPASSTQPPTATDTRKKKRCRQHFKTVGIVCRKRTSG